jgi:hypothetical protein
LKVGDFVTNAGHLYQIVKINGDYIDIKDCDNSNEYTYTNLPKSIFQFYPSGSDLIAKYIAGKFLKK